VRRGSDAGVDDPRTAAEAGASNPGTCAEDPSGAAEASGMLLSGATAGAALSPLGSAARGSCPASERRVPELSSAGAAEPPHWPVVGACTCGSTEGDPKADPCTESGTASPESSSESAPVRLWEVGTSCCIRTVFSSAFSPVWLDVQDGSSSKLVSVFRIP
jgi:hypothetical protein